MKFLNIIKRNYKNVIITICMFLIFFILYRVVPMMYDGWAGKFYYPNINGVIHFIKYICVDFYKWINGRIMSNIVCGIVESFSSEIILDFFNASIMIGIYLCIVYIIKVRKGFSFGIILFTSCVLLISNYMRNEVLFYANTAYLVPVFLVLLYYIFLEKYLREEKLKLNLILMSIIGFSICTWMEHIAVGFLITIIITGIIIAIKNKDYKITIPILISGLGVFIMFNSPGLSNSRTIITNGSLLDLIFGNFNILYVDIISRNLPLFIMLLLVIVISILKQQKINKILKYYAIISASLICLIMSFTQMIYYFGLDIFPAITNIFNNSYQGNNIIIEIIVASVIMSLSLIITIHSKNKKLLLYLSLVGGFSLCPILITPNTGSRISTVGFFITLCVLIVIFLENYEYNLKDNKILKLIIILIFVIAIDKDILLTRRIYNVTKTRNEIIETVRKRQQIGEWNYEKYVILPTYFPGDVLYDGVTQIGTFHYPQFLQAYGLNRRTKIVFGNENRGIHIENIEDSLKIKIIDNNKIDENKYMYIIKYSENDFDSCEDIDNSGWIEKDNYNFSLDEKKGYFKVEAYVKNGDIEELIYSDYEYMIL